MLTSDSAIQIVSTSDPQVALTRFFDPVTESPASDSANHVSMSSSSGSSNTGSAIHGSINSGVAGELEFLPPLGDS